MPLTPNGKKTDEMTGGKKNNLTSQRTELLQGKTPLLGVNRNLTLPRRGHSTACGSLRQAPSPICDCTSRGVEELGLPQIWPLLLCSKAPEKKVMFHFKTVVAGIELSDRGGKRQL